MDASAVLEALLPGEIGARVRERLGRSAATLHAPEVLDLEVLRALRRHERRGALSATAASRAAARLSAMRIARYPHRMLVRRAWELRYNVTAYDAAYVALAELLAAPLVTFDRRLAESGGIRASVELMD